MFCRHHHASLPCRGDERPLGKEVRPPEEPSRSLVDGEDRLVREELFVDPRDLEVMFEIALHVLLFKPLEVAPPDDPRCERTGRDVHELVEEVVLAGEYHGKKGLRVHLELTEGMKLGKDLDAKKARLVDDHDRYLLSLSDLPDRPPYRAHELRQGDAVPVDVEGHADLFEYLDDGAGRGDDGDELVL